MAIARHNHGPNLIPVVLILYAHPQQSIAFMILTHKQAPMMIKF